MSRFADPARGFTLVEMSVVLVVVGMVILLVFPALTASRQATQRALTDSRLQGLLRGVASYVQANGCLPCPTPATQYGTRFGRVRGDTNAAPCGACATPEGIVPFVSLGIPESAAKDGWGRWMTFRVDPALTAAFNIVPPTAPCLASDLSATPPTPTCAILNASQKGLCQRNLAVANRIAVQLPAGSPTSAALVLLSHGPNGYGAFVAGSLSTGTNGARLPFPASTPACAAGGFESCNADGDLSYTQAAQGADFDDLLLFLDRNNLVAATGQGACQTVW